MSFSICFHSLLKLAKTRFFPLLKCVSTLISMYSLLFLVSFYVMYPMILYILPLLLHLFKVWSLLIRPTSQISLASPRSSTFSFCCLHSINLFVTDSISSCFLNYPFIISSSIEHAFTLLEVHFCWSYFI